ncbi:MAG: 1-acyl-sn-glycerol-3-phosphate acyltransferase [Clostridia bacterium]|nr:1-acyl-sn-glycerol-3-phosphate acyltransferase [Clostridia bacterium]
MNEQNDTATTSHSTGESPKNPRRNQPKATGKPPKKWCKFRHRVVRFLAYLVLYPYSRIRYGIRIEKHRDKRQYAILYNHQTPFDQFFVGMAFPRVIYYLATEDIFSLGFVSSLLRYLVAPIPIKKQTTDLAAIKTCLRVAREGGSIAIAPEGNRTYSGRTEYMSPSIAPLVRRMKLPIALYRIEGGYGKEPRWSDVVRKGKMRSYVARVIEPEEYASLSDDELFRIIEETLYVDEAKPDGKFSHRHSAEYLERVLYVCPYCGLAPFRSHRNEVMCTRCAQRVEYLPTKELRWVECDDEFRFVADWYNYQKDFINGLDPLTMTEAPSFTDTVSLYEVFACRKKKRLQKNATLRLFGDRIELDGKKQEFIPFAEARAFTVLGRNRLNVYVGDRIYQLRGDKRFNALKYVHFYHRYKNLTSEGNHGKFWGL